VCQHDLDKHQDIHLLRILSILVSLYATRKLQRTAKRSFSTSALIKDFEILTAVATNATMGMGISRFRTPSVP
jgi:hypothetical protein